MPITPAWRNANAVGTKDTPSVLSKHVSESILVFSFKEVEDEEDQPSLNESAAGNSNSSGKTLVIGATMYRRNNRKKAAPLDQNCQAVLRIRKTDCKIVQRWTDWSPNAYVPRMRPGIFVWMARKYLSKLPTHPRQVCVLADKADLHAQDAACGLDWRHDYTHYVFGQNDFFPSSSGW